MLDENQRTEKENRILREGKGLFCSMLEVHHVPTELQVKLWDLAFTAGRIIQNERNISETKEFSRKLDEVFNG